jgi:hypothetical protein
MEETMNNKEDARITAGIINRINFAKPQSKSQNGDRFKLDFEVEYSYQNRSYVKNITPSLFTRTSYYATREVEKLLKKFPIGKKIRVLHHPGNPAQDVLMV